MMTWKNQKGFTLTELLVAMGLSIAVLGAVHGVYRVQTHTVKAQEFKMEAQEQARAALDMMVREIRNLGFFPTQIPCAPPANTAGIVQANANTLQIVYDADGNGNCTGTLATGFPADEDVTYAFNGTDITRTINDGNPAQNLTAGNVTNPTPTFSYFDNNGNATAVLANIKRVGITLSVQSRSTDVQFGGQQIITMNSNVDLRNRCFNLTASC
jgi:prepilin-type N-terminal cleavage/methylation domain-containing protein